MADVVTDILIDPDTYDILIEDGDFVVGKSDPQHVELIMVADKGHFRQHPLIGVGVIKHLSGNVDHVALKQSISKNLEYDGYRVEEVIVTSDYQISINANRVVFK